MRSLLKFKYLIAVALIGPYVVFPMQLQAQSSATIVGTVRDATGAVVPRAVVTATNVGTSFAQSRVTGPEGTFTIPLLPVGQYRLEVTAPGFQRYVRSGIELAVNDRPTIDITLNVGEVAESVTITAAAPMLEAQTGTLRGVVEQERIVNLPLNGRDMTQLVGIQAGVIKTQDRGHSEGVAYAVNGSRQNGVYYMLDGGYNTDSYRNWSGVFPNPDTVQEFSVQRSNFTAEYANATGAVVNVVTKSGTNEFHGSLFEFLRNGVFNARNFFAESRDSLKRHQFGGTIGGPIVEDRLFFFGAYQDTRMRSDPRLSRQFLPTAAMRRGDFSSISRSLTDPETGQPFPNNQIPVERFNPVSLQFLEYMPVPASPDGGRFTGTPDVTDAYELTTRIDYNLTKHRLSGRYFRVMQTQPPYLNPDDLFAGYRSDNKRPYNHFSINHLYTLSPTVINSATFAYRWRETLNDWSSVDLPIHGETAGIKGLAVKEPKTFYMSVSGAFSGLSWQYQKIDSDFHWADTLTWVRGRHELKFGGEVIRSKNLIRNNYRTPGFFTFSGSITGNSIADFMLGEVYQFWQGGGEYKDLYGNRYGLFVQDDVRVSTNLTLNLGLRWDPEFPFTDDLGRVQCFRPGLQSTRFPNSPVGYLSGGDPGCPEGGFDRYLRTFSPRFGFAWRPAAGKTVLRGGFGLFWNPQFTVLYNGFVNSAPFSPQVTRFGVKFDDPYAGAANPFPASFAPFVPTSDATIHTPLGTFGSFSDGFVPSYQETFNFTVEREVMPSMVARASYIGNLGRRLSFPDDINYARYAPGASVTNIQERRPFQNYGRILMAKPEGTSSYHGLQLSLERRMASTLSIEANYTWSKAIDQFSSDPSPGFGALSVPGNLSLNQGLSDFDVPHRFVTSYVWVLPRLANAPGILRWTIGG